MKLSKRVLGEQNRKSEQKNIATRENRRRANAFVTLPRSLRRASQEKEEKDEKKRRKKGGKKNERKKVGETGG